MHTVRTFSSTTPLSSAREVVRAISEQLKSADKGSDLILFEKGAIRGDVLKRIEADCRRARNQVFNEAYEALEAGGTQEDFNATLAFRQGPNGPINAFFHRHSDIALLCFGNTGIGTVYAEGPAIIAATQAVFHDPKFHDSLAEELAGDSEFFERQWAIASAIVSNAVNSDDLDSRLFRGFAAPQRMMNLRLDSIGTFLRDVQNVLNDGGKLGEIPWNDIDLAIIRSYVSHARDYRVHDARGEDSILCTWPTGWNSVQL